MFNFKMEKDGIFTEGSGATALYEEVFYYDNPNSRPKVRSYFVDLVDADVG